MNIKHYIALFSVTFSPSVLFSAEGESGFPQLDTSTYASQIFWLIISFGFLYTVIFAYFSPRLHKIARNRSNYLSVNLKKLVKTRDSVNKIEQQIKEENTLKSKSVEEMNLKLKNEIKSNFEQEMKLVEEDYNIAQDKLLKEQAEIITKEKHNFSNSVSDIAAGILDKLEINVEKSLVEQFTEQEQNNYIKKTTNN